MEGALQMKNMERMTKEEFEKKYIKGILLDSSTEVSVNTEMMSEFMKDKGSIECRKNIKRHIDGEL